MYHFYLPNFAEAKFLRCGQNRYLQTLLMRRKTGSTLLEDNLATVNFLNAHYCFATIYFIKCILQYMHICDKTCTRRFSVTLVVIVKDKKQSKCPLIGVMLNKLWYKNSFK